MNDYRPISCRQYAELERAILQQAWLRVAWAVPGERRRLQSLRPLDLRTREHAEYLFALNLCGDELEIRLDHIHRFMPLAAAGG